MMIRIFVCIFIAVLLIAFIVMASIVVGADYEQEQERQRKMRSEANEREFKRGKDIR